MSFNKKTIEDIQVNGKRVLVRCDFNVPLKDGVITDENRLVGALPTIKYLVENGAKVILCSHLGKDASKTLAPVAVRLSEMLGKEVVFARDEEVVGENARKAVADMKDGDVVLLENTRCRKEETKNGEELSKELASLCDIYVNDAFGTAHRAHSSTEGVTKFVLDVMTSYGLNACPPLLVGVGVATSVETAALLSKKALMRPIGSHNDNERAAKMEALLEDGINAIGLGPQGMGGKYSVMGVNIENTARHPSAIGVAVNVGCWSHRRGHIVFDKDLNYKITTHTGVEL